MKHLSQVAALLLTLTFCINCQPPQDAKLAVAHKETQITIENSSMSLFTYHAGERQEISIRPPVFEIDGKLVQGIFDSPILENERILPHQQSWEYVFSGTLSQLPSITLKIIVQIPDHNPLIRFQYQLQSDQAHALTKSLGEDQLEYFAVGAQDFDSFAEIRLSEFFELQHTYLPTEHQYYHADFNNNIAVMGPIFTASNDQQSMLLAYEHGSQLPDRYVQFQLSDKHEITVEAVKGNYHHGQKIGGANDTFESIWFIAGSIEGSRHELAQAFRSFILNNQSANTASRTPYIFYNSWNYQERNQAWNGTPYLHEMTRERMLEEIEVAHQMGIEVFVVDAGWFGKTGDWIASKERFPDDLEDVKTSLKDKGMQLGLWFNAAAAVSSNMLAANKGNIMTIDNVVPQPHAVWETEKSLNMCMVSSFFEDYADELIRVAEKYGVRYFKWDAFPQYGCNASGHFHGTSDNPAEERAHNYSFLLPIYMAKVANRICEKFPDAIVDFDLTEGERAFGLGFLAAGKFFGINNGPYYYSLDDPEYAPGGGMGANVLVFPGIARAANARQALAYDAWIPSVLFLTHYLPDDPEYSQWLNLGSLILGQNGIWGDLPAVSEEGKNRFGTTLEKYKQVRDHITRAYPVRKGAFGGSPEIHEKIDPETGKGVVVIFYNYKNAWNKSADHAFPGKFTYVTHHKPDQKFWTNLDAEVTFDTDGHAFISKSFDGPGAAIVFFGTE
ncbi:MAG: hypothetical protein HC819_04295 [Cyclobacteriaceae bacterium]|nr:hypothetical protein [Cyclobacteriaceae bacterium]